jgi:WhiB family redox-sensing transcriptional regulator
VLDALLAAHLAGWLQAFERANPWRADALCLEHPELNWFPVRGERVDQLRAICDRCLVQRECREYALEWDAQSLFGVWGGLSQRQRREARRSSAA